jgi:hypothetical protein
MSKPNNVIPLVRQRKPEREPWRDNWERALTVRELRAALAAAPPNARVYVRENGIAGVVEVDADSYTGSGGGCYGQPTVILYLNAAELPPQPKPSRSELIKALAELERQERKP